jgi:aryl-phospho-beta-D-glucosidase BglC (GH1 family)
MQIIRIGYLWERLQPTLNGPLDETHLGYLLTCIDRANARGMSVLLDCHNYGRRRALGSNGAVSLIGSAATPISALADMYTKLAARVKGRAGLFGYDIMNEPHDMLIPQSAGTYNPKRTGSDLQLIPNYKFAVDTKGFSLDSAYSRVSDAGFDNGAPAVKLVGATSGNQAFANFTTSNDATSGYDVLPNTAYVFTLHYKSAGTGNDPVAYINAGSAFGTTKAQASLAKVGSRTRLSIPFTTGPDDTKVWLRMQNLGGAITAFFNGLNLTPGATAAAYRDFCFTGQYATSSLMYQACITAIRNAGDMDSWLVVETDGYAGLHQFTTNFGPNPDIWWNDPANKTMMSFHYYFDQNHSGAYATPWSQALTDRLEGDILPALQWGQNNGVKIFIGEYGVPPGDTASDKGYQALLNTFLTYLDQYNAYGAYFAGGVQFSSETTVQPLNNYGTDRPQMAILTAHLGKNA